MKNLLDHLTFDMLMRQATQCVIEFAGEEVKGLSLRLEFLTPARLSHTIEGSVSNAGLVVCPLRGRK
jgi:hypothetical protein